MPAMAAPSHGGKRTGAGRPPKPDGDRRVTMTVRVLAETRDRIARMAEESSASQGEVIDILAGELQ